ncbi:DUF3825 domain-containing protein [Aeoliella sp. ICT_H6.2]|uniref:DUF3825 domain-containing protein n=1 Tax=Aeoliella straminimaris TaxID=2954799 RepID=A0A9X2JHN5_9BACT|nr:DUF3825 domain-containing protein [Aeoliella straminimaris]MCO6043094.1 DUF3825 domain-containing protein [Aeoliella straminimaris]
MSEVTWPDKLANLIMIPSIDDSLDELAALAEDEPGGWKYQSEQKNQESKRRLPILFNYTIYTYKRLAEEDKICVSDDGQSITFNTGLVTDGQSQIFCVGVPNKLDDVDTQWHFRAWCKAGDYEMTRFSKLPEMANYYSNPSSLVYDTNKELRVNIEHIIDENKKRFPPPFNTMDTHALQTFLKGAIDNAKERVRRNYKTAIPQYYKGKMQLLLPLCISQPSKADLALTVGDHGEFYRASTCLTLDMAYNNARQLARPDRDWLNP